jgi:hypothetical protein
MVAWELLNCQTNDDILNIMVIVVIVLLVMATSKRSRHFDMNGHYQLVVVQCVSCLIMALLLQVHNHGMLPVRFICCLTGTHYMQMLHTIAFPELSWIDSDEDQIEDYGHGQTIYTNAPIQILGASSCGIAAACEDNVICVFHRSRGSYSNRELLGSLRRTFRLDSLRMSSNTTINEGSKVHPRFTSMSITNEHVISGGSQGCYEFDLETGDHLATWSHTPIDYVSIDQHIRSSSSSSSSADSLRLILTNQSIATVYDSRQRNHTIASSFKISGGNRRCQLDNEYYALFYHNDHHESGNTDTISLWDLRSTRGCIYELNEMMSGSLACLLWPRLTTTSTRQQYQSTSLFDVINSFDVRQPSPTHLNSSSPSLSSPLGASSVAPSATPVTAATRTVTRGMNRGRPNQMLMNWNSIALSYDNSVENGVIVHQHAYYFGVNMLKQ